MVKRISSLLLCFVLILPLIGCGQDQTADASVATTETTTAPTEQPFDIAAYKSAIEDCTNEMYDSAVILLNVAEYEINFWESLEKIGGTVTAEKITSSAWEWLAENSESSQNVVEDQYDNITEIYKEIISTEISGAEAEEIKEVFDEYADAYISFYNLVCSPSGTSSDFIDECNSCISTIKGCESKLDILLA